MNTSDIRNMESKQWVFWAAAVPLTLGVLVLARLWSGPSWPQSPLTTHLPTSRAPRVIPVIRNTYGIGNIDPETHSRDGPFQPYVEEPSRRTSDDFRQTLYVPRV